jgi:hypothetical protein
VISTVEGALGDRGPDGDAEGFPLGVAVGSFDEQPPRRIIARPTVPVTVSDRLTRTNTSLVDPQHDPSLARHAPAAQGARLSEFLGEGGHTAAVIDAVAT